jgi:hypothetical protein
MNIPKNKRRATNGRFNLLERTPAKAANKTTQTKSTTTVLSMVSKIKRGNFKRLSTIL